LEGKNEATAAEINKAYKKITLKYHPDKIAARGQKLTANAKEVWLKIQKAYNTLTDADKRRKYDSSLPFDEAIPKESEVQDAKKFYTLFRECFANNAKFAVSKPVPDIGDADTPMNDVYKFYRYWDSFKTWREFSQYDEYDEEEAQDRYERRWMQNENKRGRKKYEKAERKRIILMGTRAYDNDPRIRAEKLRETEAKAAAKQARKEATEAKWAKVNDGKRLVEEAAAAAKVKAVEDKKAEQQRRKEVRALYKAAQKDLIAFCEEKMTGTKYDRFYVDELVKKYPKQEQLDGLIIKIKAIEATDVPSF
jgi:DnaJ family protein C protein 2